MKRPKPESKSYTLISKQPAWIVYQQKAMEVTKELHFCLTEEQAKEIVAAYNHPSIFYCEVKVTAEKM